MNAPFGGQRAHILAGDLTVPPTLQHRANAGPNFAQDMEAEAPKERTRERTPD